VKYFIKNLLFLFAIYFVGSCNFVFAETAVYGGVISEDTTWTKDASPYVIYGSEDGPEPFSIASGTTLTIEAGVVVKFDYGQSINTLGKLIVNGTADDKVYFTSIDDDSVGGDIDGDEGLVEPYNTDWVGIQVTLGGSTEMNNTVISYAESALTYDSSFGQINNLTISDCQDGVSAVFGSTVNIKNSNIENILGDAIFLYQDNTSTIKNTKINNVGGDAFDVFLNSSISIEESNINNITGQILYMFDNSQTNILNSTIENSNNGIIFFDNSNLNINNSNISNIVDDSTIVFYQGSNLNLIDSVLKNISGKAIEAYGTERDGHGTTTLNLSNSTISDGDEVGLQLFGSKFIANIDKTKIYNFIGDGIRTFSYPFINISDSEIIGNNVGITSWGAYVEIKNSIISENITYGISNNPVESGAPKIKAINNWWGNKSGPFNADINASGTANQVSSNVAFQPWLNWKPGEKPDCCSNVLFIPGLEASRLYKKGLIFENQLWEPSWNIDVEKLYLDLNGNSLDSSIYTKDIIKRTNIGLGVWDQDIYKSFSDSMDALVLDKQINAWKAIPYDWRLDINTIISDGVKLNDGNKIYFVNELLKLASSSETGKVTIVAHSNGGLIAKALINELERLSKENLVDDLIMVAVPQIGTPEAISAMLHGDGKTLPDFYLNKTTNRTLGENMMSAYNLLPQAEYFNAVSSPVIVFDSSIDNVKNFRSIYGDTINSFTELKNFLLGVDGRVEPANTDIFTPNVLKTNLFNLAQSNHITLDAWVAPEDIEVIQLAGWGVKTLSGIKYFSENNCSANSPQCMIANLFDREPIVTEDGDNTVVVPSAVAMDLNKYYVDLKKIYSDFKNKKITHGNIFEATSTIQFITNFVLNSNDNLPEYITTKKPISNDKTLELVLHSPVSIDIYDTEGNHTGVVNNPNPNSDLQIIEENVPGSRYMEFGEGKYAFLDENTDYIIKLQGLDVGTFTLETKSIAVSGDILSKSQFIDIPTSPDMKGEVFIATSTTGSTTVTLNIDVDGNGTNDFTIKPTQNFDPIIYLQILKKTVETFDADKNIKNQIIKKIDSIIKTLQKDKSRSAIIKIKQLSKDFSVKTKYQRDEYHKKHKDVWYNNKYKKQKLSKDNADQLLQMLNQLLSNIIK
jgi:hypothetical protein